jgi:hypothetical protein
VSNGMSSNLGQDTGYPEVYFPPPLEKCRSLTIPSTSTEVTVKLPCARHTDVLEGGVEVCFHSFLTSALDVVTGQLHVPDNLAQYPLTRRRGGSNIRSERFGHMHLCPCQELNHDSSEVQSTAYTTPTDLSRLSTSLPVQYLQSSHTTLPVRIWSTDSVV